jgi:Xaa-Pro aminopeptidase
MYRRVLEARNALIAAMKPGVTIASLQEVVATVYARQGRQKEYEAPGRYIERFVGIACTM